MPDPTPIADSPPIAHRRWLRFSLRFLMLLVVLIAIPLAWKVNRVRHQREVVSVIARLDGDLLYDYQRRAITDGPTQQPAGPQWIRRFVGDDFFADVVQVQLSGAQVSDGTLARVVSLPELQLLGVRSDNVTDQGLAMVARKKSLMSLTLRSNRLTPAGIDYLAELPNLQFLRCSGLQVDDRWIPHLAKLKSLRTLVLSDTRITDEGLAGLRSMPMLDGLFFDDTPITDFGLEQLEVFTNLERLGLRQTQVTTGGIQRIQKALPACVVRKY
jgi:hypothetical protein